MPQATPRSLPYSICLATAALQVSSSSVCLVRRHHQERHEVFEHRTAPGKKDRLSTGVREQAAQGKPALLRELPLRNPYETAESRFRSQQIVVTRVPPAAVDVVPDGQQMTRLSNRKSYSMRLSSPDCNTSRSIAVILSAAASFPSLPDRAASGSHQCRASDGGARRVSSSSAARHCAAKACAHHAA